MPPGCPAAAAVTPDAAATPDVGTPDAVTPDAATPDAVNIGDPGDTVRGDTATATATVTGSPSPPPPGPGAVLALDVGTLVLELAQPLTFSRGGARHTTRCK